MCLVLYLAVAPTRRGTGIGRQIVAAAQAELPAHGRTLLVGTANCSLDNIAFYQKCGFRMYEVKRDHFTYGRTPLRENGIVMQDMIVFRSASTTTAALRTALAVAPAGVTAVLFGGLIDLPPFTPDADDDAPHDAVRNLRKQLTAADVVLFCTPEYAGSLPGSFKNLIDWTVGTGELHRKPVAWITVAAGGRGGGASADLAKILAYVDAAVIESACVRLPVPRDTIGPDGSVHDDAFRAGLTGVLRTIADYLEGQL